jgi:hypothetical protein
MGRKAFLPQPVQGRNLPTIRTLPSTALSQAGDAVGTKEREPEFLIPAKYGTHEIGIIDMNLN